MNKEKPTNTDHTKIEDEDYIEIPLDTEEYSDLETSETIVEDTLGDQLKLSEARKVIQNQFRDTIGMNEVQLHKVRLDIPSDHITRDGKKYIYEEVSPEMLPGGFGFGEAHGDDLVRVREDLPPRVKKFVTEHEIKHCQDTQTWGGYLGSEFRATFVPMLKDPIGFLSTVYQGIKEGRLNNILKNIIQG